MQGRQGAGGEAPSHPFATRHLHTSLKPKPRPPRDRSTLLQPSLRFLAIPTALLAHCPAPPSPRLLPPAPHVEVKAPRMTPPSLNCKSKCLPKRDELLLRTVFALPMACEERAGRSHCGIHRVRNGGGERSSGLTASGARWACGGHLHDRVGLHEPDRNVGLLLLARLLVRLRNLTNITAPQG